MKEGREVLPGDSGGGWDDIPLGGDGGEGRPEPERTPPPEGYRIGMWLAILSIAILFVSVNVLYLFNQAQKKSIVMPRVLWLSTGLILLSSVTIEIARRSLKRRREGRFRLWMGATVLLGFGFLVAQLMAWQALQAAGFYINRNFRSGYAYIFTGLHGVHLIGGLLGLLYVTTRRADNWTALRRRISVDVTAIYWHFLDLLWIYLWGLVFFWR